jgi:tetratricopeptide (TPR) repeat protein
MLSITLALRAQSISPPLTSEQNLQQLAATQRWGHIVLQLEPIAHRSAAMDFYLGIAFAQLGRLSDAQSVLEAGRRLTPADPRFSVELAGVAFRQKNYSLTIHRLRQALRLNPNDAYTNDFLGTAYFLEGNLEAALKHWNRVGKPQIEDVREDPAPRISPVLLDHALAFSPAATLTLPELLSSSARVRGLGVFPAFHFDLNARSDGKFDLVFRAHELNGFGDGKLESLFLFFQGLPFQEVNPAYYNLHGEAINFISMYRWDAQKRRVFAQFSGPFERSAQLRWELVTDLRGENWAVRNGFTGQAPVLASFNMRSERFGFDLASHSSEHFTWTAGAEVSHRNFRSVEPGSLLTPQLLAAGYELKQQVQATSTLWCLPERRFTVDAAASSEAARLWSQNPQPFEKLTGSLGWHWFPQVSGDDYETSQQLHAGRTLGQPPFDELFILGLERDNNLPLRAHIGTRDGRKGSAPLGRDYLLENWEIDKNVYSNGIIKFQLGPFFDVGKITDPGTELGSHQWLFDTGAQARLRIFSSGLVFSYGKDLHTGNNAFYVTLIQ